MLYKNKATDLHYQGISSICFSAAQLLHWIVLLLISLAVAIHLNNALLGAQ